MATGSCTTLGGPATLEAAEPVCHVSYYEADAYARWAGHACPRNPSGSGRGQRSPIDGQLRGERAIPSSHLGRPGAAVGL